MRAVHSELEMDMGIDGHDIPLSTVLMLSPCAPKENRAVGGYGTIACPACFARLRDVGDSP